MTGYAYTYLEYTRSKMRFPYFFKLLQASYCTYSYNTTTVLDPAVPAGMGGVALSPAISSSSMSSSSRSNSTVAIL